MARSFGSGATFDLEIKGRGPQNELNGEAVRVHTGDTVVRSDTWALVETPWGLTQNICWPKTARAHSAGDCNK